MLKPKEIHRQVWLLVCARLLDIFPSLLPQCLHSCRRCHPVPLDRMSCVPVRPKSMPPLSCLTPNVSQIQESKCVPKPCRLCLNAVRKCCNKAPSRCNELDFAPYHWVCGVFECGVEGLPVCRLYAMDVVVGVVLSFFSKRVCVCFLLYRTMRGIP